MQQFTFLHSLWHKVLVPNSLFAIVERKAPIITTRVVCFRWRGADLEAPFEANVEHFVSGVQQVDVQKAVGLANCLFVHRVELLLRDEGRELFQETVLFELVS